MSRRRSARMDVEDSGWRIGDIEELGEGRKVGEVGDEEEVESECLRGRE